MTPTDRLKLIVAIIETVENRCMAVDGPVSGTLSEMTDEEMRKIYRLALGRKKESSPQGHSSRGTGPVKRER